MYLKALEIQGFKSFPDKTVLNFGEDITAIVGPNGSGKSNISDAIRWVMGEQSVKGLRGAKMEDVIFGGTEKRSQVGFAQVTLVLDNTEHIFPTMEESEVSVTRRYYRSGESEYYINRQSVRLKDVTELFLDTGMGREGYSIIGQGKIDEILSAKSGERREIFEEAAGIAKFRHRKEDAERKLERTEENLVRINDKIVELDELTNTKIPAAQAAVDEANATAASAQSEADAAASRLEAAQKDKENLEAQIEQTGKDYDDAHAAVAQMAREDLHGSDASTVMSVVTGSTSTQEFINSMQSRDALSRTEANAASDAANTLNTSMNRSERLSAIEKQIANLKTAADEKAASAQQAAASAQTQRDSLDQLRAEGETRRAELESQQSQLNGSVAKQAAQTVMLQSQVDSFNRQYAAEQAAAANQNNGGNQGQTRPGNNNTNSGGNNVTPAPTPTPTPTPAPAPSTNNNSGQGTSNGDYGNGYVAGQCTWWAYERRRQMGIGTPSYLGNGGQWYATAPS